MSYGLISTAIFLTLWKLHSSFFLCNAIPSSSFIRQRLTMNCSLSQQKASLRDDAKPILVDELRRRNLAEASRAKTSEIQAAPTSHNVSRALSWAKWLGLWLLNTFTATLGVAISIGIVTYSTQPFVSRATRMRFMEQFVYTHHYPLPIFVGLVFGFFSYVHFRGSYRYWVWILPTAGVLFSVMTWKQSNQTSWSQSLPHFFGYIPFPDNRDQLDRRCSFTCRWRIRLACWFKSVYSTSFQQAGELPGNRR